ncbi:MAG TPA: hypothetical protein VFB23_03635 [Candidatus Acidoferrales bacterium]|jgi:hypothetical protein|nr:hypothetical protein [Candidatus Acidoferrales bacterium]
MNHYHIRWSGKKELDWETFPTHNEANAAAKQLVRRGESYTVEQFDEDCLVCRTLSESIRRSQSAQSELISKYPWQQPVLDAFLEVRPQFLRAKVNAAERAIAARLHDTNPADLDETMALQDALRSLHALLSDGEPENERAKTKHTA